MCSERLSRSLHQGLQLR
ncbi:hypothetical protein CIB84_015688 [Bambusicola thoracicus]|uniref:Uncharacterized protein n=1 Tax=Bambusicola thoracicus TaxID=9083 RepID=A0A2P4S8Y7_BAMTH|nr:hypothetical protein CIB84_017190 [Bambusicola thoracicus]POI19622.1 hypothetical protein CIB84_016633 [Bambusicola thoracicus]POI20565.1 hypothetical protein CIB84_015688 [Bambusicola thoracicus]